MSAVEFVLPPQSPVGGLSLVPFGRPLAEAVAPCCEEISQIRSQSESDRISGRMKLLADLISLATVATLESFLTKMTARIRRIAAAEFGLLGLSNLEDDRFQVIAFDASNDIPLGREAVQVL